MRLVVDGAAELGVGLDRGHAGQLAAYGRALAAWNRRINLTAITEPSGVAIKHFVDSLAPVPLIPPGAWLLDIGSGGGFPGIPIKIVVPSLTVTLIDASRKKVHFQRHVIRELGLDHIRAEHLRAEEMGRRPEFRNAFDVVVSRALTDTDTLVSMAVPMLKQDGTIIAFKGPIRAEETSGDRSCEGSDLRESVPSFEISTMPYLLPQLSARRTLVVLKRIGGH